MFSNQSRKPTTTYPNWFSQWVADNVDHNSITIDGLGTMHVMGIVMATVHAHSFEPDEALNEMRSVSIKTTAQKQTCKDRRGANSIT